MRLALEFKLTKCVPVHFVFMLVPLSVIFQNQRQIAGRKFEKTLL